MHSAVGSHTLFGIVKSRGEPVISGYKKPGGGLVPHWLMPGPVSFHVSVLPLGISRPVSPQGLYVAALGTVCRCCHRHGKKESLFGSPSLSQQHPGDLHTYLIGHNRVTHPETDDSQGDRGTGLPCTRQADRVLWGQGRCQNRIWALPAWKSRNLVVG